jgi:hypothetical protein
MTDETRSSPSPADVLNLDPDDNESGARTIRGYLTELLLAVWVEGEGFSGKRPFGSSDWRSDFDAALIREGWVDGSLDPDGFVDEVDSDARDALIRDAVKALGKVD